MDDVAAFRELTGDLDQSMIIVTVAAGAERAGCLVGFSTPCSINPPRFLVLLSDKNHTYRVAEGAEALAIHLLRKSDLAMAELFGQETGDDTDKFARCRWSVGPLGVPLLAGCDSWFVGRILGREPLGDHVAHLLEPIAAERPSPVDTLTLRDVRHLEPGHGA